MFSRYSKGPAGQLEPRSMGMRLGAASCSAADLRPGSLIDSGIKIVGTDLQISSEGPLQIDGEIVGEIFGKEVIIGETGRVTGTVSGERVIVRGTVLGLIRGVTVTLQSTCRMEGDIHNNALVIEAGARFDGRCNRFADASQFPTSARARKSLNGPMVADHLPAPDGSVDG